MRTFIIRARKGSTNWQNLSTSIGTPAHFEVIAHSVMNAFFVANDFRKEVTVFVILDSSEDFPRTVKLTGSEGLSFAGFNEKAILSVFVNALSKTTLLQKNEMIEIEKGVTVIGYGFEKCVQQLMEEGKRIYFLDPKGIPVDEVGLESNPVFILSDHLAMPKNLIKSFTRKGAKALSLGKKMLFASQCVVILNYELDQF